MPTSVSQVIDNASVFSTEENVSILSVFLNHIHGHVEPDIDATCATTEFGRKQRRRGSTVLVDTNV